MIKYLRILQFTQWILLFPFCQKGLPLENNSRRNAGTICTDSHNYCNIFTSSFSSLMLCGFPWLPITCSLTAAAICIPVSSAAQIQSSSTFFSIFSSSNHSLLLVGLAEWAQAPSSEEDQIVWMRLECLVINRSVHVSLAPMNDPPSLALRIWLTCSRNRRWLKGNPRAAVSYDNCRTISSSLESQRFSALNLCKGFPPSACWMTVIWLRWIDLFICTLCVKILSGHCW